jgi:hypothetical protein
MIGKLLGRGYTRNQWIIESQTEGLGHEDALTQSPYNINCMNWVLGHIANSRDDLLEILGADRLMTPEAGARYRRESDPVTGDGPGVLMLGELLDLLRRGQERLSGLLEGMPPERLEEEAVWNGETSTVAEWAHFFYFHDTYHTGQTDLLRQISGKSDTII